MKRTLSNISQNWPQMLVWFGTLSIIFTILFGMHAKYQQSKLIGAYQTVVKEHLDLTNADLDAAYEYNDALTDIQLGSTKEETLNITKAYQRIFNENNGMIGILNIQKIGLKLPIYHGTEDEVLNKGVGHYENSSFPLDNYGSRSILTGHNGLPGADMLFTRLDEMDVDDKFYITLGQWNYHFKVKKIIPYLTPEEANEYAQEDHTIDKPAEVTLITCTPYGINTHRLLVIGEFKKRTLTAEDDPAETRLRFSLGKESIVMGIILISGLSFLIYNALNQKKKVNK